MKPKIYITSLHLMHGGVEMAISALSNALAQRGYEVELLCTYHLGEPAYPLDSRVKITYLTTVHPNREEFKAALAKKNLPGILREGLYAMQVLRLKKQVLKEKFQQIHEGIIISTRNEDSVLLSKYGQPGVKKIAQLHHDHGFQKKLLSDFAKHYQNIDVFALLTEELRQEVSEIMRGNTRTQCVVIPNFLPDSTPTPGETTPENQVVTVGRLDSVKGFRRLIKLWKPILDATGTALKIIGEGLQRPELESEIARLGLENSVLLTGAMNHDAVLEEMRKSFFYAMTSHSEGFPFVLLEAMSQGLPAIAYDVRVGPRAIIQSGTNGYLIPDDDENAFITKAIALIQDPHLRNQLSSAALKRAEDFSETAIIAQWETVFATSNKE